MSAPELEGREAVSVREAAALCGIGGTKMYELLREGSGPPTLTIGRRRLIRIEALREWLADLEAEQNGGGGDGDGT